MRVLKSKTTTPTLKLHTTGTHNNVEIMLTQIAKLRWRTVDTCTAGVTNDDDDCEAQPTQPSSRHCDSPRARPRRR